MNGVGFLIREMHSRGLRIRSGPYGVWKGGVYQISPDVPEDPFLLRSSPEGQPGCWWVIEAKDGPPEEIPESVDKRHKVVDPQKWTRDWESTAGTLVDVVKAMAWVFEIIIFGEIKADRHEWLCCDLCDMAQALPKKYGAASQNRKCHMTPRCEGYVRRLPDIWLITHPMPPKKPSQPKAPRTPGAERLRLKLHLEDEEDSSENLPEADAA